MTGPTESLNQPTGPRKVSGSYTYRVPRTSRSGSVSAQRSTPPSRMRLSIKLSPKDAKAPKADPPGTTA